MDSQFLSFPILSSFILFIFTLFIITRKNSNKNQPPGPLKLPIIGNLHNLVGGLPHYRIHQLSQKHGPLMHLQLGEISTIILSSPETAKQALKTHDLAWSNRPFNLAADIISYHSTDLVFARYGDYWRQLRKICVMELLSAKRVQSFRSIRQDEVVKIVKLISSSDGSVINFSKMLSKYMFTVVSRAAFGKMRKEQEDFVPRVKEIMELAAGFTLADVFPSVKAFQRIGGMKAKMERIHHQADVILEAIIKDHKERIKSGDDHDDLVDVLLRYQDTGDVDQFSLSMDGIKAVILDVFVAGSETSSTTLEWTMSEMMKNPRVLEKAQAEVRQVFKEKGYVDEAGLEQLQYLNLTIKEALRLHPPLPLLAPRESQDESEIDGYKIPKYTNLMINAWALGRDPKHWDEPEKYMPERFSDGSVDYKGSNFEFIPFGAGRRICPGMSFGVLNVELPLANLLYHFDWKLPNGMKPENLDMDEAHGISVKRKNDLNLIPVLRNPLPSV